MFSNPASILWNPAVSQILQTHIPRKILEVGGGCLRNALYLIRMGHSVTVLEVPHMRDRFPEQYQHFERVGGRAVESLKRGSQFEIVIATFVIETICSPRERIALVRAIYQHLTSDGTLVLSARGPRDLLTAQNTGVRCGDGYVTPNRSFARSYTREQMNRLLKSVGFDDLLFLHKPWSKQPEYLHVIARKHG